jgi:thymidylate synthase
VRSGTGGDCHLYTNHRVQADLQLAREPLPLPKLVIKRTPPSLFDYRFEDFELLDYVAHGSIKAPIAV